MSTLWRRLKGYRLLILAGVMTLAALSESVAELQIAVKAGTATTIQYASEQTLIKYRLEKLEAERDRVSK